MTICCTLGKYGGVCSKPHGHLDRHEDNCYILVYCIRGRLHRASEGQHSLESIISLLSRTRNNFNKTLHIECRG